MLKPFFLWACLLPFSLNAQVSFERGLSWQQIKEKARAENKYIFLDCYATWCRPCKTMDSLVYSSKEVGDAYNNRFLSVRVQMDKTSHDDSLVRKWYAQAATIQATYNIEAFPSFLFFASDGTPLHKVVGYKSPAKFIDLANEAQNPQKQLYTIARNFRPGSLDTADMKGLVNTFRSLDKSLAGKIAADYLQRIPQKALQSTDNIAFMTRYAGMPDVLAVAANFTNTLPEKKLYTPDMLELLASVTKSTKDRGFPVFFKKGDQIDAIVNKRGFSQRTADRIIYSTEITPVLESAAADTIKKLPTTPDFEKLAKQMAYAYDKGSAERVILSAQISWYGYLTKKYNSHWKEYANYFSVQVEKDGYDSTIRKWNIFVLNNVFWDTFFKHSNDKQQLSTAAACMEKVVQLDPKSAGLIDTYANLLYKAGNTAQAIAMESKACELSPTTKVFLIALEKMKKGEPTWPLQ